VLAIFFAFGASFELPVAMVILVLLGWVSRGSCARPGLRHRRHLHPGRGADRRTWSQLMLAMPMCLLYEAGILAATLAVRSRPGGRRADHVFSTHPYGRFGYSRQCLGLRPAGRHQGRISGFSLCRQNDRRAGSLARP
jgi:hypothetical protein